MTHRWRRAYALVAVCLAIHAAPALAASTPASLAGTTTVSATRTASITVRLPRAIDIDEGDIRVTAPRGRMAAFALKRVGAWDASIVAVVHTGYCGSPACATQFPHESLGFVWTPGSTDGLSGRFAAGTYRIYVVTDGAPATFVLTLRGLSGSVRLTPRDMARGQVAAAKPTMAEPSQSPQLFAGGSTHRVGRAGGLQAMAIWKDLANGVVPGATGPCTYEGEVPSGGSVPPYQLPCDGGKGAVPPWLASPHDNGQNTTAAGPGHFFTTDSSGYLLPSGTFSFGGYNNTTGVVNAAYVHQVWLDF